MALKMTRAGIQFTEYEVDAEPGRQDELTQRLDKAGIPRGAHEAPILFVGNRVFMGSTPISNIQAAMQELSQ